MGMAEAAVSGIAPSDATNFSETELKGGCAEYTVAVEGLKEEYGFDFVGMGLTAYRDSPLRWVYSAGAMGERHKRIVLSPGRGIGGAIIKSGMPMRFDDIDEELDPCDYSSCPIVFTEDLRSFCALPLIRFGRVAGALLCAFRSVKPENDAAYSRLIADMAHGFCGCGVVTTDFVGFESVARESSFVAETSLPDRGPVTDEARTYIIEAQEVERRRIARDLHDGVAQEALAISFAVRRVRDMVSEPEAQEELDQMGSLIDRIIDDLHDMAVTLRPSTLDHFGLASALRTRAAVLEKTYGAEIVVEGALEHERFDSSYETQVYRICQEALLNACKYSRSERIFVRLAEIDGRVRVEIVDHGVGFDTVNPRVHGSGCGLPGMRERAHLIGADFHVESGPGGTTVVLTSPMPPVRDAARADEPDGAEDADEPEGAGAAEEGGEA